MLSRLIAIVMSAALLFGAFTANVQAAVISTQQAMSAEARAATEADVRASLARDDVRQAMVQLGVDPSEVDGRIASLSDAELMQMRRAGEAAGRWRAGGGRAGVRGAADPRTDWRDRHLQAPLSRGPKRSPMASAGWLLVGAIALSGCSTYPPLRIADGMPGAGTVLAPGVPFHPQTDYQCGPAALATVLAASQHAVTPEALAPRVFLPGRQGSLQLELLAATRREGRIPYVVQRTPEALFDEVRDGRPARDPACAAF